jgi:hypothetical protein
MINYEDANFLRLYKRVFAILLSAQRVTTLCFESHQVTVKGL